MKPVTRGENYAGSFWDTLYSKIDWNEARKIITVLSLLYL
jgi:hypothetical protein